MSCASSCVELTHLKKIKKKSQVQTEISIMCLDKIGNVIVVTEGGIKKRIGNKERLSDTLFDIKRFLTIRPNTKHNIQAHANITSEYFVVSQRC